MEDFKPQNAKKAGSIEEACAKCSDPIIEPKYDGWRFIVTRTEDGVRVESRTGKVYTSQTPRPILDELERLPVGTILDGEMVDLADQNCTACTNVFGKSVAKPTQAQMDKISYVVFDTMRIETEDVRRMAQFQRRALVEAAINALDAKRVVLTTQAPATQEVYERLLDLGFEGAMVKDRDAHYASGKRGHGWFKLKAVVEVDVVVMSMDLDGKGQHDGKVGRFVVGQHAEGELVERAKVNPYDDAMRDAMTCAVRDGDNAVGVGFVGRVCTIKHYGLIKDGWRHPVFVRWREDKRAEECFYDNG